MEMQSFQHPDSVWTWKSSSKGKVSLWLPYFERVEPSRMRIKDHYQFRYQGGEISISLKNVDFIMLYGANGHLPVEFLDRLASYKIPLMIHRRNMPAPYLFFPDIGSDPHDVLTAQIISRTNQIRCVYLARTLIHARLQSMSPLITIAPSTLKKLNTLRSVDQVRQLEAQMTARYWKAFYAQMGLEEGIVRRDKSHPINQALNAASYFMSGVLLRWVLFHKLSPEHGFLHVQTSYPSLVFDLIEPYRYIFERALLRVIPAGGLVEQRSLTAKLIAELKRMLEEPVYVPATRQTVRRKNLLHGAVLGLRAYLVGDMKRFVVPVEGRKIGGRPLKVSYRMPGQLALEK